MQQLQSANKAGKVHQCTHSTVIKENNRQNCFSCGIYLPKVLITTYVQNQKDQNITVYRQKSMSYECLMDIEKNYKAMFKYNYSQLLDHMNEHYKKQREELINYIVDLGNRLQFSTHTINLGILYLDISNIKEIIPPSQLSLYAVTSIFLASKAIELDMKIPFISKLRKYSSLHYRPEEIKKAEIHLIKLLDWQLQLCTLSQILDFYFAQGILFSNDEIQEKKNDFIENEFEQMKIDDDENEKVGCKIISSLSEGEIEAIMKNISKEVVKLNAVITKDLTFFQFDKRQLALACIIVLRKRSGIINWNNEFQIISGGLKEESIGQLITKIEKKLEISFSQTPILTSNSQKTNYQLTVPQQVSIKQIEPVKQIQPIMQRPPSVFLQPRKENVREIVTSRPINESFQGNYFRQPQKKVTQEFVNPNEYNNHSRKLYKLNTAYASFETKINQFGQFN